MDPIESPPSSLHSHHPTTKSLVPSTDLSSPVVAVAGLGDGGAAQTPTNTNNFGTSGNTFSFIPSQGSMLSQQQHLQAASATHENNYGFMNKDNNKGLLGNVPGNSVHERGTTAAPTTTATITTAVMTPATYVTPPLTSFNNMHCVFYNNNNASSTSTETGGQHHPHVLYSSVNETQNNMINLPSSAFLSGSSSSACLNNPSNSSSPPLSSIVTHQMQNNTLNTVLPMPCAAVPIASSLVGALAAASSSASVVEGDLMDNIPTHQGPISKDGVITGEHGSWCSANIFVANIPSFWDETLLRDHYAPYGNIISAKAVPSRRFGFVRFSTVEEAQRAIIETDKKRPTPGLSLLLHVSMAVHDEGDGTQPNNRIFVRGLPEWATDQLLYDAVKPFANPNKCSILVDGQRKCKGTAFVEFDTVDEAKQLMENASKIVLCGGPNAERVVAIRAPHPSHDKAKSADIASAVNSNVSNASIAPISGADAFGEDQNGNTRDNIKHGEVEGRQEQQHNKSSDNGGHDAITNDYGGEANEKKQESTNEAPVNSSQVGDCGAVIESLEFKYSEPSESRLQRATRNKERVRKHLNDKVRVQTHILQQQQQQQQMLAMAATQQQQQQAAQQQRMMMEMMLMTQQQRQEQQHFNLNNMMGFSASTSQPHLQQVQHTPPPQPFLQQQQQQQQQQQTMFTHNNPQAFVQHQRQQLQLTPNFAPSASAAPQQTYMASTGIVSHTNPINGHMINNNNNYSHPPPSSYLTGGAGVVSYSPMASTTESHPYQNQTHPNQLTGRGGSGGGGGGTPPPRMHINNNTQRGTVMTQQLPPPPSYRGANNTTTNNINNHSHAMHSVNTDRGVISPSSACSNNAVHTSFPTATNTNDSASAGTNYYQQSYDNSNNNNYNTNTNASLGHHHNYTDPLATQSQPLISGLDSNQQNPNNSNSQHPRPSAGMGVTSDNSDVFYHQVHGSGASFIPQQQQQQQPPVHPPTMSINQDTQSNRVLPPSFLGGFVPSPFLPNANGPSVVLSRTADSSLTAFPPPTPTNLSYAVPLTPQGTIPPHFGGNGGGVSNSNSNASTPFMYNNNINNGNNSDGRVQPFAYNQGHSMNFYNHNNNNVAANHSWFGAKNSEHSALTYHRENVMSQHQHQQLHTSDLPVPHAAMQVGGALMGGPSYALSSHQQMAHHHQPQMIRLSDGTIGIAHLTNTPPPFNGPTSGQSFAPRQMYH